MTTHPTPDGSPTTDDGRTPAVGTPVAPDVPDVSDVPERAGRRQWAGLAVLALPCLVVSMDAHLLHLALPQIAADLRVGGGQLLWVVDVYVFLGAGSLLTMGMVGDRIGRRRLLLVGAAAFAAASVLAASASSATQLVLARGLLGVAGAMLMPSTLALVRTMFRDPGQRRQALGVWTASFALGGLLGPVAGGLVLVQLSWPWVFGLAVPPMLLLLAVGRLVLPEARDPLSPRVDVVTAATSLTAVLAAVLGIKGLAAGEPGPGPWLALVAAAVLGSALVRRQRRATAAPGGPAALVPAGSAAPLAVNALAFFVLYGTQYLTAQYLQLVLGLSPLAAGLWGLPGTVGYLAGSAVGPLATRRVTPPAVVVAGLLLSATGFGLLTLVGTAGLVAVVAGTVLFGFGLAPVYALTTEMVVSSASSERSGTVAATQETGAELGGALGIALLGSVSLALYRSGVTAGLADLDGLPADAAARVRGTLAGALVEADRLAGGGSADVADVARDAFTRSYVVAEALGVALLLAAAAGFALLARRRRARDASGVEVGPQGGAGPRPVASRADAGTGAYGGPVHRSRLSTLLIDAPADQAAACAAFWSAALGVDARPVPGEEQYTSLPGAVPALSVAVQAVDDAPRLHVDIETDDVPAETERLLALGAVEVGGWLECRTLRAPGGHLVCVIPRHSDEAVFDRLARAWD